MEKPRMIEFQHVVNRGANMNIATSEHLPFIVKRIFWISDVDNGTVRGEHASKTSEEIVVAICGEIKVSLTGVDGETYDFLLENPNYGIYIPSLFWGKITFSTGTVLMALASDDYDENDYIRNFADFLKLKNQ